MHGTKTDKLLAGPLFKMIWEMDSLSNDLMRWQEAIVAFVENIRYQHRSEDTKTCFGELAGLLTNLRRNASQEIQDDLSSFFGTVIPALHGRPYSADRKVMLPPNIECGVLFSDEDNQTRVIGLGHIKDVCPSSCLGFCLETKKIIIERNYERGDGIIGYFDEMCPYSYRQIIARVNENDPPLSIEWVTLTVSYQLDSKNYQQKFPCRIMRAWLQSNGAVGLALRAPLSAMGGQIPPTWEQYVRELPPKVNR